MLSESSILAATAAGELCIDPFHRAQLRSASYVLRLGTRFRRWKMGGEPILVWSPNAADEALSEPFEAHHIELQPNEFVLATTLERIGLSEAFAGAVSPLSHVARFGLSINQGADLINPGFGLGSPASLTLELVNHNCRSLVLMPGMPIAHLRLIHLKDVKSERVRRSVYDGADPVISPKLYEEWHAIVGGGK